MAFFVDVETITITGPLSVPAGAKYIFINNIGAAAGSFTGNVTGSTAVSLGVAASFSFPYVGVGYNAITIDGTGTSIEITVGR